MEVSCTRDSVAMGDDADAPHETVIELRDGPTVADLVDWLRCRGAPASVVGGSTWALRVSGRVVALLSEGTATSPARRVEPVGDQTTPVTSADHVHLDYLLADELDRMTAFARDDPTRTDLHGLARYSDDR
jgi:hypothetical protein